MQNEIAYSRPVTLTNILRFAVPTIAMSVFMSFYTMVDGLFVSNLIGTSALSALNLVYPVIALVTAISTMLATGGSAAIMRKMGEGKPDEAKQDFTFLILVNVLTGLVMCGLGYLFMGKIFGSMSLSPEVSAYCWEYLSRYLLFTVPILLMNNFTLYMIAAGKASLSLLCSVAGGVTNIVLDYLFIAVFRWGIGGAAVATGLGYSITAIVGLLVFSNRNSLLHFVRPVCRPQTLGRAVTNGCSEMATALVNGIITLMFNWTMLKYVGEDGVAAITIISYVLAFAGSLYAGYAYGVAPMLSFYYGEQNHEKLRKLVRTSLDYLFIAVFRWGIGGAAVATGLGYSITAIVGLLVFSNRNSLLHFVRPVCRPQTLGRAVTNGCSEMATALVNGIITLMFNWTMLKYVGEDGVAAITIISYVLAFAGSLYAGYAYGVAPMLSFYYGEQNHEKLRKLVRTSLKIIGVIAAATVLVSLAVTEPLVSIFARPGTPVYDLAVAGNRICSLALLFVGFNIFASGMFTALSNGLISAVLAFSRTFVFTVIAMLALPALLGVTGIWLATPAAELAAIILSAVMLLKYRRRYCY